MLLVFKTAPKNGELDEELRKVLFLLQGFRTEGPPARRFQSAAIVALLERVKAVGLIHLDKHAPSLGLYGEIPSRRIAGAGERGLGSRRAARSVRDSADARALGSRALGAPARLAADRPGRLPRAARAGGLGGARGVGTEEPSWPAQNEEWAPRGEE